MEGVDIMITRQDVEGIQVAAQNLMNQLDAMTDDEANAFITQWLIDTGALDENGNEKKQIVNGDFFGW